jgi:uncharacterized integral membrane protein
LTFLGPAKLEDTKLQVFDPRPRLPGLSGWEKGSSQEERDCAMETPISAPLDMVVTAVLIAVFVMVFVVARGALKEVPLFGGNGSWPVAFCTAVLAVMGLLRFLGSPDQNTRTERTPGGIFDFILLPYATLAIAILLVLLLLALGKVRLGNRGMPSNQRRVDLPPEVKTFIKQRQTTPDTSLRKRLEKQTPAPPAKRCRDDLAGKQKHIR